MLSTIHCLLVNMIGKIHREITLFQSKTNSDIPIVLKKTMLAVEMQFTTDSIHHDRRSVTGPQWEIKGGYAGVVITDNCFLSGPNLVMLLLPQCRRYLPPSADDGGSACLNAE
jgi:hypothetical protein